MNRREVFRLFLHLSFLICVLCVKDAESNKKNCNSVLENKIVSFEYNYYPGNQLEPGAKYKYGYTMFLPSTGENNLTFYNGAAWEMEKCGSSLCILSRKNGWENYYVYMPSGQSKYRAWPNLWYYEDIQEADPAWQVQFDIECDDCSKREHCYISNMFYGEEDKKNYGRMFTDAQGFTVFGYQFEETEENWFDWSVHVHDQVPAGAAGAHKFHLAFFVTIIVTFFTSN